MNASIKSNLRYSKQIHKYLEKITLLFFEEYKYSGVIKNKPSAKILCP